MLYLTRQDKIVEIVNDQKEVTTEQLAEQLDVSVSTIRNDLNKLEEKGLLKRFHGGAVALNQMQLDEIMLKNNFNRRSKINMKEKDAICGEAAKLIFEGQTIFFDASSTVMQLIPHLQNFSHLTIVTNGIFTAMELQKLSRFNIIMIGGVLRPNSGSVEGVIGAKMLDAINSDIMFCSARGFTLKDGLTDFNIYEVELKKKMVSRAGKLVALLDHSKIGQVSTSAFAEAGEVDMLITDHQIKEEDAEEIAGGGIRLTIAP